MKSNNTIIDALRIFKARRDDLLHEDTDTFDHNLGRFVAFCQKNDTMQRVIKPAIDANTVDVNQWWEQTTQYDQEISFPDDPEEEFGLRYKIIELAASGERLAFQLGAANHKRKLSDSIEFFRSVIVRPFVDELTHRLGKVADMASPDERALQAVPLNRIPSPDQARIFLSHKSVDKPMVQRYFKALTQAGFSPWMDEADMPAGSNLERDLYRGFEHSCAAVFFITENFKDEKYLASEVDYARIQHRKKDKKFVIITLRYSDAASVPDLLTPYVYKDISNDLEGFTEILRAVPLELGPVRWKANVVE